MKMSKIFLGLSAAGVISYLAAAAVEAAESGIPDAFGNAYVSQYGVILVLSLLYQLGYFISHIVKKSEHNQQITDSSPKWFKVLFITSYIPLILLIIYSLSAYSGGFTFIFSTCYGWEAVYDTLFFTGLIFCIIPVFPVCMTIQTVYIIKAVKRRKRRA